MKRLPFLLWIVCFSALGCDEAVDFNLVAEQLQRGAEQASAVQTILPDDVLAAMQHEADQLDRARELILGPLPNPLYNSPEVIDFFRKRRDAYLAAGIADLDFHALQKAFYTKYIDAGGIAIVANNKVEDVFLIAARDAILLMTSKYPELRERLLSKHRRFYMVLIKDSEDMMNMPENQLVIDDQLLGIGGLCSPNRDLRFVEYPTSGPCFAQIFEKRCPPVFIFIHEVAPVLEIQMELLKPGFLNRLDQAYEQMLADVGREEALKFHMLSNPSEYWAGGAEWWFQGKGWREKLYEEHPLLAELLAEWFPKVDCVRDWDRYHPPGGPTKITYRSVSWKIVEEE